jgi:hypothetical protein
VFCSLCFQSILPVDLDSYPGKNPSKNPGRPFGENTHQFASTR